MSPSPRIDGLLVAGGRSQRFGTDKRRAKVGTHPAAPTMAERSLGLLRACVDGDVFIAGTGAFDHPVAATFVRDAVVNAGPLGGIVGALGRSRFGILVLPCDSPLLRPDTLESLARLGRRHARAAVVRSARGLEPLVAFYPRPALPFLAAALREGNRALHRLLPHLRAIEVMAGDSREMHNVNRPADLELAATWR
ncbi:MAG: molybdenum cofactor guanylyltransferase [Candidatus Binatia bacterium]